jgi:hypothetical protein
VVLRWLKASRFECHAAPLREIPANTAQQFSRCGGRIDLQDLRHRAASISSAQVVVLGPRWMLLR